MKNDVQWRVISDYTGAGHFVLDGDHAIVGTATGVQSVPRGNAADGGWRAEFGSRCIGVRKLVDDNILVSCRGGLLLLSPSGDEEREKLFAEQLVHEAIPYRSGFLVAAGTTICFYDNWDLAWRYSLNDALGQSVESVRLLNMFQCGDQIVVGAVDYDSGIGRIIVLSQDGQASWLSEPGPVSDVFPADAESFVWSLTGYGRFETQCSQLNGQQVWLQNFAGLGTARADGSIAMIVGSNESPQWDHWEVRIIESSGRVRAEIPAKGRAPTRPTCTPDGSIYFVGYVLHLDPSSSRVDYTNFLAMPQELQFQHLVGLRKQIPEYEVYFQKLAPDLIEVETLLKIPGSFSLAQPQIDGDSVAFCDGPDLIGLPK